MRYEPSSSARGVSPRASGGGCGGLPVGASLVGRIGGDHDLLRVAAWVEGVAPRIGRPSVPA